MDAEVRERLKRVLVRPDQDVSDERLLELAAEMLEKARDRIIGLARERDRVAKSVRRGFQGMRLTTENTVHTLPATNLHVPLMNTEIEPILDDLYAEADHMGYKKPCSVITAWEWRQNEENGGRHEYLGIDPLLTKLFYGFPEEQAELKFELREPRKGLRFKKHLFDPDNSLTWDEFEQILGAIDDRHGFYTLPPSSGYWRAIKYIRPVIDLRDNRIRRVEFQGLYKPVVFNHDHGDRTMFERIMAWLEGDDEAVTR